MKQIKKHHFAICGLNNFFFFANRNKQMNAQRKTRNDEEPVIE